ncbi:MAG TPA: hypothetical protein VGJ14_03240 [Sporichthyaceae bacterium]|jgi:hypothetical protein
MAFGAAATLAVGASALIPISRAYAAAGPQIFNMSAQAVALQSTLTDPGIPFGLPFSVGSYGASSALDSNGGSTADAGAPYAPLVSTLPSTGNGTLRSSAGFGIPVVPAFPGYVIARDPIAPSAWQSAGGYDLRASALPSRALGEVSVGAQGGFSPENNAFAYAKSLRTESGVRSEGAAGVHALTLAGILDLANVSSFVRLAKDGDGRTVAVATTDLGTVSFAGVTTGVTRGGIGLLGAAPTPVSPDSLAAINDALRQAGITVTYVPAHYTYTDGSVGIGPADSKKEVAALTSAALRVFLTNTSERGTTTQTVNIGQVTVGLTAVDLSSEPAPGPSVGASTTVEPGAPTPAGDGDATVQMAAAPLAVPATTAMGTASGSGVPVDAVAARRLFRPASAPVALFAPRDATSFEDAYLILAATAAVTFLVGQAIRGLAVRRR